MKQYILIFLYALFIFLMGCTTTTPPFTESQFYSKVTDFNYTLFIQGYYDGNCLVIDNNKISIVDCGSGGGNIIDTNTQTAGWTDSEGNWLQDLNLGNYNLDTNNIYAKIVWSDDNREYGTIHCPDGNIIVGYLVGFTC